MISLAYFQNYYNKSITGTDLHKILLSGFCFVNVFDKRKIVLINVKAVLLFGSETYGDQAIEAEVACVHL